MKIEKEYSLLKKDRTKVNHIFFDEILALVENYHVSNLILTGEIYFLTKAIEYPLIYHVGKIEQDELILDKNTGEILMKEYRKDQIIAHCAKNGACFFDAIFEMEKYTQMCFWDERFDNKKMAYKIANNCGLLAGGQKYTNFYRFLTGF